MVVLHAAIRFHNFGNCFAYLTSPAQSFQQITGFESIGVYKIIRTNDVATTVVLHILRKKYYNAPLYSLFINVKLAELRNFHENDHVVLERITDVISCVSCRIMPKSEVDWFYMHKNVEELETEMLKQLRIIEVGSTYPFWNKYNCIYYFAVVDAVPVLERYTYLTADTEMHVIPQNDRCISLENDVVPSTSAFHSILNRLHMGLDPAKCTPFSTFNSGKANGRSLRILPKAILQNFDMQIHVSGVYIHNKEISSSVPNVSVVRVSRSGSTRHALLFELPAGCVNYQPILNILQNYEPCHCLCSSTLIEEWGEQEWIDLQNFGQIDALLVRKLSVFKEEGNKISYHQLKPALQNYFFNCCGHHPIIVPKDGLRINLEIFSEDIVSCLLLPADVAEESLHRCLFFTSELFPELQFVCNGTCPAMIGQLEMADRRKTEATNDVIFDNGSIVNLRFQRAIISDCMSYLGFCLSHQSGQLLIVGPKMSGKTTLLGQIADELLRSQWAVFSKVLNCELWKGDSPEKIEKIVASAMRSLIPRRPSALFLDNVDAFSRKTTQEENNLLLEKVIAIIGRVAEQNRIILVASAQNKRDALRFFSVVDDKRFHGHVVHIQDLEAEDRFEYLRNIFGTEIKELNLNNLAKCTSNFTIGDLKKYVRRLRLESCTGQREISSETIQQALNNFCSGRVSIKRWSANYLGHKLTWDDVGGMCNIKQLLTEMIIWPTKYSKLYADCPIRLGHGVLLYGPSGCGKTLIAKTLAAECGYCIIFVRGPELLSKYVGQSEENVRKTFDQARASRPCLIVFDGFDSLGSKRGHEDTGVTDRVVNQLLTELDGVDELNGVYVVATTNRLDMIDSALLRPGRFDKIIECGFPDLDERLCTLNILCREMCMGSDVDLLEIAMTTSGWTGADLKGLVTDARLNAQKLSSQNKSDEHLLISQGDLLKAMHDCRSSKRSSNTPRRNIRAGMFSTVA